MMIHGTNVCDYLRNTLIVEVTVKSQEWMRMSRDAEFGISQIGSGICTYYLIIRLWVTLIPNISRALSSCHTHFTFLFPVLSFPFSLSFLIIYMGAIIWYRLIRWLESKLRTNYYCSQSALDHRSTQDMYMYRFFIHRCG